MILVNVIIGERFGNSTVLNDLGGKEIFSKSGKRRVVRKIELLCDCGKKFIASLGDLKTGNTKGCGCSRGHSNFLHGITNTPIHHSWALMKQRCNNKNKDSYHRYGGRGITYDQKWESFSGFYEDMGASYKNGLTLDRIDFDKNYFKENCRWVTMKEQSRNKSSNRVYKGKCIAQWIEELGLTGNVYSRLSRGWSEEEALFGKK